MKIKKFYYYSPEKLKLIPIKNFLPKTVIFLLLFGILITFLSIFVSYNIFDNSNSKIIVDQNKIIDQGIEKELNRLRTKYRLLAEKFKNLQRTTNDVRLAVNLEPLDLDELNYGIGGSEFKNHEFGLLENKKSLASIYEKVNTIESNLNFENSNYSEILNKFSDNKKLFNNIPAIRPVNTSIGDRFGMRFHPILKRKRMHNGLDFLANIGEKVFAPGDGVVTYVGRRGGYGRVVRINHGFGYETLYAHLSKYKVKKGQKVRRGDLIALSGNSGSLSTGPHLHYEVRHKGISLNPRNFIYEDIRLFDKPKRTMLASK